MGVSAKTTMSTENGNCQHTLTAINLHFPAAYQMVDAFLNAFAQRQGFSLARDHDYHLPAIQNGLNSHRQCHSGHSVKIVVEKSGIGQNGIVGKRFHSRSGFERRT
jgi:hypothetical protein